MVLKDQQIQDLQRKLEEILARGRYTQTELQQSVAGENNDSTLTRLVTAKLDLESQERARGERKEEIDFWYGMDRFY